MFIGPESGAKAGAEAGCESDNEHDNSHAEANDVAHSSSNDRQAAMACFHFMGSFCRFYPQRPGAVEVPQPQESSRERGVDRTLDAARGLFTTHYEHRMPNCSPSQALQKEGARKQRPLT